MTLLDTDVLIELFKGNESIFNNVKTLGIDKICINKISVAEMYIGALNKIELNMIKSFLNKIEQISINNEIVEFAIELIEMYSLSHNLKINDALIASTAILNNFELYTLNLRDFKYLPKLKIVKF